jgi:predicted amidohydrolase YtcJ
MLGESMKKISMLSKDMKQVQQSLRDAWALNQETPRLLGSFMLLDSLGEKPHRRHLDEAVDTIPVFIDSADLHSCWVNTAALSALGIDKSSVAPQGGTFVKDQDGELTGLLLESAVAEVVWPYLAKQLSLKDRIDDLESVFDTYLANGVTGAVDMAMSTADLEALEAIWARDRSLPIRITAYWVVYPGSSEEERLEAVRIAAAHRERIAPLTPWLRIAGIKIISDGVVDSCTAYLTKPYHNGALPGPIWPADQLNPVIALADSLDLQVAIHAIGDAASSQALDAFEAAIATNGDRPLRRHRIEHLEVVTPESISRLTRLGITASMQPVHGDPVYLPNWRKMLDEDERCDRACPWIEFADAGSHVAFGTDAPTAPHHCLPNIYTAVTRRSTIDPEHPEPTDPRVLLLDKLTIPLESAIRFHTVGGARSIRSEDQYGALRPGMAADFCVISVDPFAAGVTTLRKAQEAVKETWINGKMAWKRQ